MNDKKTSGALTTIQKLLQQQAQLQLELAKAQEALTDDEKDERIEEFEAKRRKLQDQLEAINREEDSFREMAGMERRGKEGAGKVSYVRELGGKYSEAILNAKNILEAFAALAEHQASTTKNVMEAFGIPAREKNRTTEEVVDRYNDFIKIVGDLKARGQLKVGGGAAAGMWFIPIGK